jgi:hypothetical protein
MTPAIPAMTRRHECWLAAQPKPDSPARATAGQFVVHGLYFIDTLRFELVFLSDGKGLKGVDKEDLLEKWRRPTLRTSARYCVAGSFPRPVFSLPSRVSFRFRAAPGLGADPSHGGLAAAALAAAGSGLAGRASWRGMYEVKPARRS